MYMNFNIFFIYYFFILFFIIFLSLSFFFLLQHLYFINHLKQHTISCDAWTISHDFNYYVIFIDHFTEYSSFILSGKKSEVKVGFIRFKDDGFG